MAFGWIGRVIGSELGRVWRSIAQAVKNFYDYLGLSVLISAFWYALAFLPVRYFIELTRVVFDQQEAPVVTGALLIAGFTVLLVAVLWAAPVTAAAYRAVYALMNRDGFYIRDLFRWIGTFYVKAVVTSALAILLLLVLLSNVWFYSQHPNAILRWLTILFAYVLAFWVMGAQYLFPFIVQQDVGVLKTLKRTALVALDNVIVSFLLALIGLLLFVFSVIPLVPMVLIFMGLTAALHNFALIEILKKYDDPPPSEATAEEK